jgi:hypothetical protein
MIVGNPLSRKGLLKDFFTSIVTHGRITNTIELKKAKGDGPAGSAPLLVRAVGAYGETGVKLDSSGKWA